MRVQHRNGFTLIELLTVIAIIGILASVLIPNLLSARATSVDRSAQAYARNLITTVNAEISQNLDTDLTAIANNCEIAANATYVPIAGSAYPAPGPGFSWAAADACLVEVDAAGNVRITMNYLGGADNTQTIGSLSGAAVN